MIEITATSQPPFAKPWGNYLLEKIVETQAPEEISWLPQTVGWKILSCVLLLLIIRKIYSLYQNYQRNAYRREALTWLKECEHTNNTNLYKQLPLLLRQTALNAFNRTEVSQLTGQQWEHWLDEQCPKTSFTTSCPNILHQLAYMPIIAEDINTIKYKTLLVQTTLWIKHHRRPNV
jgi:hypothetical protein